MSTTPIAFEERRAGRLAIAADYVELTKPKIAVMLLAAVAVSGCVATWGQPDLWRLFHAVFGTALVAASSCVWNQWLERRSDLLMKRTRERPLPAGRITANGAAIFGAALGSIGVSYLLATVGWKVAAIGAATWLLYVVVYTPMKRTSPWNTAVGAVAGALPLLMGWAAMGAPFDLRAAALFAILFFWQFPHFMAIAWIYRKDYAQAGMQMLPVVDPTGVRAGRQAIGAALALTLVSIVPFLNAPLDGAPWCVAAALALGVGQLLLALRFSMRRDDRSARHLLWASLVYLPAMLGVLLAFPIL
ncbi:heme o synthase [Blastopirellula marina]|uniref:Protoheme IX farnesyltransferase n=1 Tax=Blastopirellula marina DSM 3645 TaxID=314230 RepID=A3ZTG3_9BACT|nr:heme o synthase [Blastopirellula marina]EAQ80224.1 protoheme IX farnesyltransferase [Blastopirellula marina DSM 3645]